MGGIAGCPAASVCVRARELKWAIACESTQCRV